MSRLLPIGELVSHKVHEDHECGSIIAIIEWSQWLNRGFEEVDYRPEYDGTPRDKQKHNFGPCIHLALVDWTVDVEKASWHHLGALKRV